MASSGSVPRLRFTPRSLALAIALLGVALVVIRLFDSASRVLGWILTAGVAAGLLHLPARWLSRYMRRGVAIAIVALVTVGAIALVAYKVADNVTDELHHLQRSAPRAAAQIERTGPFAEQARKAHLARWTREFVREIPRRLQGGSAVEAVRAATTRGVAFLVTGVLTLFFLLHGPRIAEAAFRQDRDQARAARLERVVRLSYARASGYLGGTFALALLAGSVGYVVARVAKLPGPAALGLWVALWDIVPLLGAVIGALPLVLLGAAGSPDKAIVIGLVFIAYQTFESLLLQRHLEARTVKVGPFLTLGAGLMGLELYGIGGVLMAIVLVTAALTVADEMAPTRPGADYGPGPSR